MYAWMNDDEVAEMEAIFYRQDAISGADAYYDREGRCWAERPDDAPDTCYHCRVEPWYSCDLDRWFCECDADPDQPWYESIIEEEKGRLRNDGTE